MPEEQKIQCPKCESFDTIKNGYNRILCKSCDQTSTIEYHPRKKNFEDRPPCPHCGAYAGRYKKRVAGEMYCGECGKYYTAPVPQIDNSDLSDYTHEPKLEGDFLVAFDPHFPFQHSIAWEHAKRICEKWDIRQCVIPGDTLDLDAFKHFLDKHPDIDGWKDEKLRVRESLLWLAQWMEEVHLLIGNHELRRWKALMGKENQTDIFEEVLGTLKDDDKGKFYYYRYPSAIINNSWIVDHPNMSSVIPGRVPFRLSDKYMTQHLISLIGQGIQPLNGQYGYISGHGHLGGEATDTSGEIQIADGMVMCDPDLFGYYKLKRSARPAWRIGFNVLRNNYLYRFPENNTDWSFWLNGEREENNPA